MYKIIKPLFLICETPLHVGSGSDLGIVDLPIQREKHTGFPKIESSSLKGAIRQAFEQTHVIQEESEDIAKEKLIKINSIFGYDESELPKNKSYHKSAFGEDTQFAGCVGISDARLLLFPVKSLHGVFAWLTCPRVIEKFKQDLEISGIEHELPEINMEDKSIIIGKIASIKNNNNQVQLEEFVFKNVQEDEKVNKLGAWLRKELFGEKDNSYWAKKIEKDIVVINDTNFTHFVQLYTEVITRTKIDNETGTVQQGALFNEEYLPAESIMYSLILFADEMSKKNDKMNANQVYDFFKQSLPNPIQVGANATLGKGILKTKLVEGSNTTKGGAQ